MITPRQIELGVNLVTGLVVISVAVALAGLTWRLMGEPGGRPRAVVSARPTAPPPPVDLTPVLQLAPFGLAPSSAPSGAGGSIAGLTLRGIVRAQPSARSTALIAAAGGAAQPYAVGQTLPGGGVLDAIEIDHVLVRASGRSETLAFPQKPVAADTAGVAAIRAAIPASVSGLPPVAAPPSAPASFGATTGSAAVTGAAIEDYRDRIASSPQTLIGALGASATSQGYRVGPNPSPQMREAGLLPGDVVAKINGVQVGDAERDRHLFDDAVTAGRARVEVVRDGRRITLSFPLR